MTTPVEAAAPSLSSVAGTRIRGLRGELRISQSELALMVRLSRTGVSDRESGVKAIDVDELPGFAAVLGVSVAYLMGFTDDRSRPLEEAALEVVRHQGLEPRTRWFAASEGDTRPLSAVEQLADVIPFPTRGRLLGGRPRPRPATAPTERVS